MSEQDAVEKPLGADVVAELVRNHRDLLSFVERRVGSRAEAEDILQEAFVRGVQHVGALRAGDSSSAWFYRMLRNAVVDRFRRRGAESRAYEAFAHEIEDATTPLEARDVVCTCVRTLAQTLKPDYADALQRVEIDGLRRARLSRLHVRRTVTPAGGVRVASAFARQEPVATEVR